ncbi:hypothetical protein [Phytoactinopolyspora halotolerans]|uniref:Uncharacterized protein n=1 Tax=Phytoactinopolyspora halotolerans TaxID=1981512 RepID=A0A6L9S586_9ACTN|nr:hypothetical protein [Phytoactinopolyspora halotolerans]NED99803.1 hypothetical protein [Phytoactinopolyspora halotolerans]
MEVIAALGMFRDGRTDDGGGFPISAGSAGFWIVIALALALVVLYRSMRKQLRRVDFDESASTDEERVRSHEERPDQG